MQTETLSTTSDIVTPSVESPSERPTYPTVDQFGKPYRPLYLALLQYAADHNGVIEVQDAALKTLMGAQHYRLSTAIADFRPRPMTIRVERQGRTVARYIIEELVPKA